MDRVWTHDYTVVVNAGNTFAALEYSRCMTPTDARTVPPRADVDGHRQVQRRSAPRSAHGDSPSMASSFTLDQ